VPDVVKAIEGLTAAIDTLAQSAVASEPRRGILYLTAGLLLVNLILAVAVVWSACLAARSAGAARKSAEAATEHVRLTREEFVNAHAPKVGLACVDDVQTVENGNWHDCTLAVSNTGHGPALGVEVSAFTIHQNIRETMSVHRPPKKIIYEGTPGDSTIIRTYQDKWLHSSDLVVICHCRHLYQPDGQDRVYHTVVRAKQQDGVYQWEPEDYFGPGIPLPPEYEERCSACQAMH